MADSIGPNQVQGGFTGAPSKQTPRYQNQVEPQAVRMIAPQRGNEMAQALNQAGQVVGNMADNAERKALAQKEADQALWMAQASSAAELQGQQMLIEAQKTAQPGQPITPTIAQNWQKYVQAETAKIKDPMLKSRLAATLTNTGSQFQQHSALYDNAEQSRYGKQNFNDAVDNKARFYGALPPDAVDGKFEQDAAELNGLINKIPADPADKQAMKDYLLKNLTDAANMRKIDADPKAFLAQQATARNPDLRMNDPNLPRGLRNNNPGNLTGNDAWQGKTGTDDKGFAQFDTPEAGLRAMAVNLRNQQQAHGLSTVQDIISKYAPPSENNTPAYIAAVSQAIGARPDEKLDLNDPHTLGGLMQAMVKHENGAQPYADRSIMWAANAAIDGKTVGPMPPARPDGGVHTGSTPFSMGTYEQQRSWIEHAESAVRAQAAEQQRSVTQGNQLISTVEDRLKNGLSVPADEMTNINNYVAGSNAPELANKWALVQDQAQAQQGYMKMGPIELRNYIGQVLQPAVQNDGATVQEAARLDIAQKTLAAMDTQVQSDPLGWYQRTGGQVPQLDLNNPSDMQQRRAIARNVSGAYGVPLEKALFTPQESSYLANTLQTADVTTQLKTATLFANGFGSDTYAAAKAFKTAAPIFGAATAVIASKQGDYMRTAMRMLQGAKMVGPVTEQAFKAEFNNQIAGIPLSPEMLQVAQSSAYAYYKGVAAENADAATVPNQSIAREAVEATMGRPMSISPGIFKPTSNIIGYRDDSGQFVSESDFEDKYSMLDDKALKAIAGNLPQAATGEGFKADDVLSKTHLVSVGDGLYGLVDSVGGQLVDKDNRPFILDARKMDAYFKELARIGKPASDSRSMLGEVQ